MPLRLLLSIYGYVSDVLCGTVAIGRIAASAGIILGQNEIAEVIRL